MPELPEVETVRRGISPHIEGKRLLGAHVREPRLRWPVPEDLDERVRDQMVVSLHRRGKYLLFELQGSNPGWLIAHLGMSGSLRLTTCSVPPAKHDHLDLVLEGGQCLRLHDPRRFGAMLWCASADIHPLIRTLGIEPLDANFDRDVLYTLTRNKKTAIKTLLMDAHLVVGIGNIYANEVLFKAGIDPRLEAGKLSRPRCERLVTAIKDTLTQAIAAGGSSLRDFVDGHGKPGYFQQNYYVYGRTEEPCRICQHPIHHFVQGGRSSFYCRTCQRR